MIEPVISVVIPAFNAANYLGEAIDSVLAQSAGNIEVIVVDDASTDGTAAVAGKYGARLRLVQQKNTGVSGARNRGVRESIGRYVAFLDADDTWLPGKIEKQLSALEASRHAGVCSAACLVTDQNLKPIVVEINHRKASALEDLLLLGNVVGSVSSALIERRLLLEAGGFDPTFSHCADWEFWIRLARRTEFVYLPEALVTYRQHGTNMSRQIRTLEEESFRLLVAAFADPSTPPSLVAQRSRAFGRNWMALAGCYFNEHRFQDFARCALKAVTNDPRQLARMLSFPYRRLAGGSDWRRVIQ
jgi:teichuronic acid biosynthesis glycosyltransferase TuaG